MFTALIPILGDLINLIPNANQRTELAAKLQDAELAMAKAQSDTNTAEAANPSVFVSGWRPFIGWVCGFGLVYSYLGPLLGAPQVDLNALIAILSGMLGLGGMRTVEKIKGVTK